MKIEELKEPTWMYCLEDWKFPFSETVDCPKGNIYLFTRHEGGFFEFENDQFTTNTISLDTIKLHFRIATIDEQKEAGVFINEKKDLINSPEHYKQGGIETIDFIQAKLTPEEFKGYLKGNAIKYLSRATMKGNEADDYAKSQWYINRLNSK